MTVEQLRQMTDPFQRAEVAVALVARLQGDLNEVEMLRNVAFNELRHIHGYSLREIADRFGVSKSLVYKVTG